MRARALCPRPADRGGDGCSVRKARAASGSAARRLATARQEVGAGRIGDRVYVVGGLTGPALAALASVESTDVTLDTWSAAAPLPAARDHMGVAALGGELYVVGGFAGDFAARSETFIYASGRERVAHGPGAAGATGRALMVAHAGRLVRLRRRGRRRPGDAVGLHLRPDERCLDDGDEHADGTRTPERRRRRRVHLRDRRSQRRLLTAANERYDPATDSWMVLAPMPDRAERRRAAALGGRIWGRGRGEVPQLFAVNEVYDVASDRWCSDTPMAIPRHGIAAVALDDRILTPGRRYRQGLQPTAAVDVFVPGDEPTFPSMPLCPAAPASCRRALAPRRSSVALSRPADTRRSRLVGLDARCGDGLRGLRRSADR